MAEAAADPELQASSLEACRGLLRSILTHWEPVFPSPEPAQEPADGATPRSEAPGPEYTVTSLVVRWMLQSVAECPLSRAEAAGLLSWLKKYILPQTAVVADLLKDSAVKSSIFKLYSRLCRAEGPAGPEQSVACLFNSIMLQLVAAQGLAGTPFHPAVETLCLTSLNEEDGATQGNAGLGPEAEAMPEWAGLGWGAPSGPRAPQGLGIKCCSPGVVDHLPLGLNEGAEARASRHSRESGGLCHPQGGAFPKFQPFRRRKIMFHIVPDACVCTDVCVCV